jgi:GNAT superfamily N-acetyltransferase
VTIRSRVADSPRPRRELRDSTGDTAMLGAVRIERLGDPRAAGFDALQAESEQAGLRFLRRLADEWASGANRFDRPGEVLFGARIRGELVAVGGLNVDPYATAPRVGRVRHVYVLSAYRRLGVGRQLVAEIVAEARGRFDSLRLSTANRRRPALPGARLRPSRRCRPLLARSGPGPPWVSSVEEEGLLDHRGKVPCSSPTARR